MGYTKADGRLELAMNHSLPPSDFNSIFSVWLFFFLMCLTISVDSSLKFV